MASEDKGFWTSCSGCTDSVDGYVNPKYFPTHPVHGVPQGMGCDECGGSGIVHNPPINEQALLEAFGYAA